MALKRLLADLSIISKLGRNPGLDDGLSEDQIKEKFDQAANIIKDYINDVLLPELEKTVDVDALLSDILDITLSKTDKAANAKTAGDAIRGMRTFFEKVVHGGDYVLESDRNFSYDLLSDTKIRIYGGEGVIQGNLFSINTGRYVNVDLEAGTYGLNRNDLVVVRCTKDQTGNLNYSIAAITGNNSPGNPADPEYSKGDINANDNTHDFPLYRIRFSGYDIQVVPLFEPQEKIYDTIGSLFEKTTTISVHVTLASGSWSEAAPYTQTVEIEGLTDLKKVMVYPDVPDDPEEEAMLAEETAKVTSCKRSGNVMTFRCREEQPTTDIPIIAEVYV